MHIAYQLYVYWRNVYWAGQADVQMQYFFLRYRGYGNNGFWKKTNERKKSKNNFEHIFLLKVNCLTCEAHISPYLNSLSTLKIFIIIRVELDPAT